MTNNESNYLRCQAQYEADRLVKYARGDHDLIVKSKIPVGCVIFLRVGNDIIQVESGKIAAIYNEPCFNPDSERDFTEDEK